MNLPERSKQNISKCIVCSKKKVLIFMLAQIFSILPGYVPDLLG